MRYGFAMHVLVVAVFGVLGARPAVADMVITVQQDGANISGSLSGSLDLTGLSGGGSASISSDRAELFWNGTNNARVAWVNQSDINDLEFYFFSGTMPFGDFGGPSFHAVDYSLDAYIGDAVVVDSGSSAGSILVPEGYVSGDPLSGTFTILNADVSDLFGITDPLILPSGSTISVQIAAVPEPSSMALLAVIVAGCCLRHWRKREGTAVCEQGLNDG